MKINIRKAEKADMTAIHQLVFELAVYEKSATEMIATVEEYKNDFTKGWFEVMVAETDDAIVGMALYYTTYSTWKGRMLYLEDFVVKQQLRRKGIGQMLFEALIEEAQQTGAKLIKWQVLDWNEPALGFYEKNKAIIEKGWWNGKIFLAPVELLG